VFKDALLQITAHAHGRRLRGDWGTVSPKFEAGDGPCISPPIFGEVVLRDVREKYEVTNKR